MNKLVRKALASATAVGVGLALGIASAVSASAYQPSPSNLYVADNPAACNKNPCVLDPKSPQLPSGRIVAAFENDQTAPVGQTMPVHKSDDEGTTWQKPADVKAPDYLSSDAKYAKYTSNWTNPYLYVLPQNVGNLSAGTLLLASVVSGDDDYYEEQKAANSSWTPSSDGDRKDVALALYSSTDDGANWNIVNIIATGGWQGGSAGSLGSVPRLRRRHRRAGPRPGQRHRAGLGRPGPRAQFLGEQDSGGAADTRSSSGETLMVDGGQSVN
jgi:hypothetical protein